MAFDNYERYGVRVKKTAADVDDPYSLNGSKSLPILKDLLSEISILRQDIAQLKDEIAALHQSGPRLPIPASVTVDESTPEASTDGLAVDESTPEASIPDFDVDESALEPVSTDAEIPEPSAPILDSAPTGDGTDEEVTGEVTEDVSESEPEIPGALPDTEAAGAPAEEPPERVSTGGFFDETPADTALILSDTELMNILSSADLPPVDDDIFDPLQDGDGMADTLQDEMEDTLQDGSEELDTPLTEESYDELEDAPVEEPPSEISLPIEVMLESELPPLDEQDEVSEDELPREITETTGEPLETELLNEEMPFETFFEEITLPAEDAPLKPDSVLLDETPPDTESVLLDDAPPDAEPIRFDEAPPDAESVPLDEAPPDTTDLVPLDKTPVFEETPVFEMPSFDEVSAAILDEPVTEELAPLLTEELAPPLTEELAPPLTLEIKSVLTYLDDLLESLPENKIIEFAQSDKYETYKKIFRELGLA